MPISLALATHTSINAAEIWRPFGTPLFGICLYDKSTARPVLCTLGVVLFRIDLMPNAPLFHKAPPVRFSASRMNIANPGVMPLASPLYPVYNRAFGTCGFAFGLGAGFLAGAFLTRFLALLAATPVGLVVRIEPAQQWGYYCADTSS